MPDYDFQHPDGRIITLHQSVHDKHEYIDDENVEWKRVFYPPQTRVDSIFNIDPRSPQEFVRKTGQHKGKLNDIFQLSAELSEKRKSKDGVDGVERKSWDNYEKARPKTVHPGRKKQELKGRLSKLGADIDL